MGNALVVGGNSGIGLALVQQLLYSKCERIYIVGKEPVDERCIPESSLDAYRKKVVFRRINLICGVNEFTEEITDIDTLLITVGFGRVARFDALTPAEVRNLLAVNFSAVAQILHSYYGRIRAEAPFYCAVMGSIAGHLVSPLFSVYGAAKAGLCTLIENLNAELAHDGYTNRILEVSPGSIRGTAFNGGTTQLTQLSTLATEILARMYRHETRYIPDYDTVYGGVLERYHRDPIQFAMDSYAHKLSRVSDKPQVTVGYLSGTFDLFHIGHLNLLRRAKEHCDFLIVGVHKSGAWKKKETYIPFEERIEIIRNIRYVDLAVESMPEDSDAYDLYHYDKLFVGSDYKGTERFVRYENYFKNKDVEIVYFPYTNGTSSTQLRAAIRKGKQ